MATNELDAAYEDAFGTKALDPVRQAINDQKREDVTRLKVSASNAVDMQPDRKAEAMKIAEKMKLPTAFVESNFDAFSREHQSTAVDFDRMVNEAPELAQWLGHPDNSVIAKDDIDNLRNLSDSVKEYGVLESVYQGLKSGVATAAASTARIPSASFNALVLPQNVMAGKINDLNRGYADKQQSAIAIDMNATDINITGKPAELGQPKPIPTATQSWDGTLASPEWLRNNTAARFFDFAAEEEAKNLPELSQSVVEKIGSGDWKAAGRAAAVQLATNAPQMAQTIALAMMGMPTAAAGMGGLQQMASSQQDSLDKGLPIVNATANSIAQGGAEFLGERLITVPGLAKWSASIEKSFGKDTARKVIWDAAKTLGSSFAQEGAEEAATQVAQDSSDFYFGVNPDLTLKQGFENMLNAGIIGGLMGGSTTMTMVAGQAAKRAGEIRGAERTKELLTAIKEGALTSKLRARMPEAHAKAIDTIAKDGPVESILMPADAVQSYFQGKGLDASAEAQKLGFGKEFSEAMEIGGDVKVSLGQFISKVSESEHFQGLVDNSKFQPDALTPNEAKTEQSTTKAQLKLLSKETDPIDSKAEMDLTPEERMVKSARAVKADVEAQLLAMNDPLMGPKEAKANALLWGQGMLALASRSGRDPLELYNERKLKVQMRESLTEARQASDLVRDPGVEPVATETQPAPMVAEIQRNESGAIVYDVGNLAALRRVISDSAIEQGAVKRDDEGYAQGMIGSTSTFPEFFKNKGYKKADVLKAIDKVTAGQALTEKQQAVVDDLYEGYIDSINRREMFQDDRELFQSDAALEVAKVYGEELFQKDGPLYGKFKAPAGVTKAFIHSLQPEKITMDQARQSVLGDRESIEVKMPAGARLLITKDTFGKSAFEGQVRALSGDEKLASAIIAKNIESLIPDLVFNEVEPNKKPFAKPWAKDYRRFYGVVEIDGSEYAFHFKTERPVRGKAAKYDIERVYFEFARKLETPDRPAEAGSFEGSKTNQTVRPLKNFPGKAEITIGEFAEKVNSARESDPMFQGNEAENSPNGRIVIRPNKQMEIDLFRGKANLSTFLHETGHFYLEIMDDLAKDPRVSQRLKNDYSTIREWLGAKPGEKLTVDQHEQWARGFELYLARGNAPTKELRGAFASFKVWLSAIYKNLNRLNVELTPEITGVMDRLLATDEQLAEAVRGQPSLFDNPLTQGMNAEQAAQYKKLEDDEKRAMNEELTAKAVAHEMKKREAAYKEARKEVQAKVELEANAMTSFNLLAALQRGTMADGSELPDGMKGIKLDRQSIFEVYGKEFLESLPRPFVYAKEGGLHFDLAAEMFGFTSGDAMLKSLVGMPTKKEFIERETNRQMDIRFPDEVMQEFPEQAVRAAHTDTRRKRLYFELETLARDNLPMLKDAIKRVARRVPREADVKAQAIRLIAAKNLADIKPYVFERAERKAAKEAGVLLANGDIAGAFEAKRRELLNYELFKAATDAVESMEKAQEFFKKFRQSDEDLAKTRDTDLVNVGRAILAQHGIGKADKTAAQYLENMKKYDPESYDSAVAIIMNADLTPAPLKEINFDHFTNLHDTVKSIWDLSKQARSIEIDGKRMDREEIKIDLMSAAAAISDGPAQKEYNSTMTDDEKTGLSMLSMRASLTRMEHWATASDRGNRQGAFTRYFINPIRDAITNYRIAKKSYMAEAKAILDPIAATLGAPRVIISDELGFKFKSKAELLGAILHTGNESNLHKLLIGYGWAEKLEDGTVDTTKWDRFLTRMWAEGVLTKQDYDAVQGIWDLMEKLKPDTQKAHKAMYGFYFNEITSKEIVTPWGNYRGGYVPAKTDPYTVDAASRRADENALESRDNTFAFPTTGRGATKSRVENYTAPLQLDVRLTLQHIDWALRFTYLEPRVKELGRLATDPEFRQSMKAVDPEIVSGMIVPWLQRVARQNVMTSSASKSGRWWDQKLSLLRSRSSLQMMAFNIVNAMQNYTALFPTMMRVRPGLMMANFWTYAKGPKDFAETVASKSPYMSTRLGDQARDIQHEIEQILENPSPYVSGREWLVKHSQILQAATQNSIDTVVWHSAYTQELEKGVSDKEAVRAADATVRESLGSMAPEDVSSFESGSALLRALTMFYGFFNNQANLLKTEFDIHKELGLQKRAGRAFYAYTLVVMAPAIVGALMSRAGGGKFDDDDDGEYIDDLLDVLFLSQFKYMTAMVPGGGILNSIVNRFNDKAFDDKISVSPIIGTLEKVGSAPFSVVKAVGGDGKSSAAIKDSLTAIGFITGTPGGALARPLGYLADVAEGEARPSGPIDFGRGLVTGKAGEKQ